jgi:hypothetical protein
MVNNFGDVRTILSPNQRAAVKLKNLINFETHAIPDLKFQMRYYESYFQRSIAPKRIKCLERFFVLPPSHLNQRGSLTGNRKSSGMLGTLSIQRECFDAFFEASERGCQWQGLTKKMC